MEEYFLIQTLFCALENLLKHEGEREANSIGLEIDSKNLEQAKAMAEKALEEGKKYLS